jgi:hypothetical protein
MTTDRDPPAEPPTQPCEPIVETEALKALRFYTDHYETSTGPLPGPWRPSGSGRPGSLSGSPRTTSAWRSATMRTRNASSGSADLLWAPRVLPLAIEPSVMTRWPFSGRRRSQATAPPTRWRRCEPRGKTLWALVPEWTAEIAEGRHPFPHPHPRPLAGKISGSTGRTSPGHALDFKKVGR